MNCLSQLAENKSYKDGTSLLRNKKKLLLASALPLRFKDIP